MKSWFRILRGDFSSSLVEGFTERLQGTYTVTVMFVVAGVLLWNTGYSNTHIACSCPTHFTYSSVAYANQVCWSKDFYILPFNDSSSKNDPNNIPHFNAGKYSGLLVIGLATLLLLPKTLMRYTTRKVGSSASSIFELASDSVADDNKSGHADEIAKAVSEFVKETPGVMYFTVMYMAVKLAFLITSLTQLVLIERFLGIRFIEYINGLISSLRSNTEMVSSPRFPDVVFCDYMLRRLGNIHRYTLQCSMPVNQLYEKLWILFLFWVITVTIIGTFSLTKLAITSLIQQYHVRFIGHRLAIKGNIENASDPQAWFFVHSYLGRDGFLILRLMSENVNEKLTVQVIDRLWGMSRGHTVNEDNDREPLTLNPIT